MADPLRAILINWVSQSLSGLIGGLLLTLIAYIIIGINTGNAFGTQGNKSLFAMISNIMQAKKQSQLINKNRNSLTSGNVVGKYPFTATRLLNINDVLGLNKYELRLMRNEILARHGRIFQSPDLVNYFSSQKWYKPVTTDVIPIRQM